MSTGKIQWGEIQRRIAASQEAIEAGGKPSPERARAVLQARAEALAREGAEAAREQPALRILAFLLGREKYGVELEYVREVFPLTALTLLPGAPLYVLGIVNLRGRVLSVLDIQRLFDLPRKGVGELDRIIVLQRARMEFGILGNSVLGVVGLSMEQLQPPLPTMTELRGQYLKGVTADRLAVLDAARMLSDESIIVREDI